jgi:hypothetical protein
MMKEGLGWKNRPANPQNLLLWRQAGPCRITEKALYQRQLWYLIRSRIESGPPGTRSFLLPEPARSLPRRDLLGQIGWTDSLLDSPNPT